MIKINTNFEKENFVKDSKDILFLVELEGIKNEIITKEKIPLNLSISIDISGSMDMPIGNYYEFFNRGILNGEFEKNKKFLSKIDQAKKAAKKAVEQMQDGDYISIVLFSDKSEVLIPAIKITEEQKENIYKEIDKIVVKGSTNLHEGWLTSATEVAKNISKKSLNRVIVLTDGQTNAGICNKEEISSNVKKLYEKSITTTTFGIGEQFNEDLLLEMSSVGGGNFYYIDDDNKLEIMFKEEFSGLKNIAASNVKLMIEFTKNMKVIEQFNQLSTLNNEYILSDIYNEKKNSLLFKLSIPENETEIEVILMLKYKDEHGEEKFERIESKILATTQEEWDNLPFNQEVKVQETLLIVANNKIAATRALDSGDVNLAHNILMTSQMQVNNSEYQDSRLNNEVENINVALLDAKEGKSLRKIIATQSYQTRYNK